MRDSIYLPPITRPDGTVVVRRIRPRKDLP